ncbi:hypothetical protein ILFOPFJJ_00265 [Ensifer psoraleae]|nr:hypothetical protein [Sinorhizobium psoraleae]
MRRAASRGIFLGYGSCYPWRLIPTKPSVATAVGHEVPERRPNAPNTARSGTCPHSLPLQTLNHFLTIRASFADRPERLIGTDTDQAGNRRVDAFVEVKHLSRFPLAGRR